MSCQQGWLDWAFVQLLLLRGGFQMVFNYFTLNNNPSYITVSRPIPNRCMKSSLISPSNSRTIVSAQYLVNTVQCLPKILHFASCFVAPSMSDIKWNTISCLIYHFPLCGYHIKHSFLCFKSFPKGLFTWREDDPRRRNNFSLSLRADIFVRVVAK